MKINDNLQYRDFLGKLCKQKNENMKNIENGRRSSHSVSFEWKMHVLIIT